MPVHVFVHDFRPLSGNTMTFVIQWFWFKASLSCPCAQDAREAGASPCPCGQQRASYTQPLLLLPRLLYCPRSPCAEVTSWN